MIPNADTQILTKQAADTRDIARFKQEMNGLKKRLTQDDSKKEKDLRKACQNFEAVFISKLWQGMKSTVPKEGYLHSKQEEQYSAMFDRQFAEKMSEAGGIGLADMIYGQLSQKLKETSRETLSGGVAPDLADAQPIALDSRQSFPLVSPKPTTLEKAQPMTLEDWGGREANVMSAVDEAVITNHGSDQEPSMRELSEIEVQTRLETLARRLEAHRLKAALLSTSSSSRTEKYKSSSDDAVGQILAKNG